MKSENNGTIHIYETETESLTHNYIFMEKKMIVFNSLRYYNIGASELLRFSRGRLTGGV